MAAQWTCRICGSGAYTLQKKYTAFMRMNSPGAVVRCRSCRVITRIPSLFDKGLPQPPPPAVLKSNAFFVGGDAAHALPHLTGRLHYAAAWVSGRRLLDIGCGNGAFLKLAKEAGWQVMGTELTPAAAEQLNAAGIPCIAGEPDSAALAGQLFDLVHLNHVLEHAEDPVRLLRQAVALLAPGGIMLVEVPNEFEALVQLIKRWLGGSNASVTNIFEHEWFFSPASLATTLSRAGLRPVKLFTAADNVASKNLFLRLLYRAGVLLGRGANIEAHIRKD